MKKLYLTLVLLFSTFMLSAQTDTVCFTEAQVLRIDNKIQTLQQKDSLTTILVKELEHQNSELKDIVKRDSLIIAMKNEELGLREKQVNLYLDLYKQTKPKWYDKKIIWFGLGMTSVITSSWVVANTTP